MTTETPPAVFTKAEAQKMLRISRSGIERRIKDGTIAVVRIGARVLIPARVIDKLLEVSA